LGSENYFIEQLDLVKKFGYNGEVHEVITSDGYILKLHRITGRTNFNNSQVQKPVAFVMHGLLCSSACFIISGPEKGLGNEIVFLISIFNEAIPKQKYSFKSYSTQKI